MLKGLDGLFDSMRPQSLLLTAPVTFSDHHVVYNTAAIFAPTPHNLVLQTSLRRSEAYFEDPGRLSEFQRVADMMGDPLLGVLQSDGSLFFHQPKAYHTAQNNTLPTLHRPALDTDAYPTGQTTFLGAKRYCRGGVPPGQC